MLEAHIAATIAGEPNIDNIRVEPGVITITMPAPAVAPAAAAAAPIAAPIVADIAAPAVLTSGITGINMVTLGLFREQPILAPLTNSLTQLVETTIAEGPVSHANWARLPTWLESTLGERWSVDYEEVAVSDAETQGLWQISNTTTVPRCDISVHIVVASVTTDQELNMKESVQIVRDHVHGIVTSAQRDSIWIEHTLSVDPGNEEAPPQYIDGIVDGRKIVRHIVAGKDDHHAGGRVVITAGNVFMDIAGMTSSDTLLPYALKLLNKTIRRGVAAPKIPCIRRQAIKIGVDTKNDPTLESDADTDAITVTGVSTRFSVVFLVDWEIATAGASSGGSGVLFERSVITELGSGEGHTVELFFIAGKAGDHVVHMYVAELETMVQVKSALKINVKEMA
jgi:hypothetical protein